VVSWLWLRGPCRSNASGPILSALHATQSGRSEARVGADSDGALTATGRAEQIAARANVGAIFRSAAALGVDAVLVSPRCGDPLYRRSVRVSMGTVFQVPWARLESWPGDLETLRAQGFTVAAMELTGDAVDLDELAARNPGKLALVLGTEGAGMSAGTLAAVDLAVKIPMRAGVDSLNVAAASAVAFWELRPRD
jgi:tRNA G18 (ribose-2'-O)-methylase SpoU